MTRSRYNDDINERLPEIERHVATTVTDISNKYTALLLVFCTLVSSQQVPGPY